MNAMMHFFKDRKFIYSQISLIVAVITGGLALYNYWFDGLPAVFETLVQYVEPICIISMVIFATGIFVNAGESKDQMHSGVTSILGDWQPPAWLKKALCLLCRSPRLLLSSALAIFRHPKKTLQYVLPVALISLVALGGYYLNKNRPVVVKSNDSKKLKKKTPKASDVVEEDALDVTWHGSTSLSNSFKLDSNEKIVLTPSPIRIYFSEKIVSADHVGKEVQGHVKLIPPVEGKFTWVDTDEIKFTPKAFWPMGFKVVVDVNRKTLSSKRFNILAADVKAQTGNSTSYINRLEFYEDPRNPSKRKVIAALNFSEPVDVESVKKNVRLTLEKQIDHRRNRWDTEGELSFTVLASKLKNQVFIHSENLAIARDKKRVHFYLKKGAKALKTDTVFHNEDDRTQYLPTINEYFSFNSPRVQLVDNKKGIPEQVLMIKSKTPLDLNTLKENLELHEVKRVRNSRGDYVWSKIRAVSFKYIESEREFPKTRMFKIDSKPGATLRVVINEVKTLNGLVSNISRSWTADVPRYKKQLKIIQDGSILARGGEKKLSIMSRNIKDYKVTIQQILPEQLHHLMGQSTGTYKNPHFSSYNFRINKLSTRFERKISTNASSPHQAVYSIIDLSSYLKNSFKGLKGKGVFKVTVNDEKSNKRDARLITITDLGIIVKKNLDGSRDIFVQSLETGKPISGAKVQVIGENGLPLIEEKSSSRGHVSIPKLYFPRSINRPIAIMVKNGPDASYIKLNHYDRKVNFSAFDISGESSSNSAEALKAFVFNDRGIYRPGEKVNLGFIIKDPKWEKDLKGLPIELTVTNSSGKVFRNQSIRLNSEGYLSDTFRLSPNAGTGTYTANVYTIRRRNQHSYRDFLGSTEFSVQEFLPDRLKVKLKLSQMRNNGWVKPDNLFASLELNNLFGLPAAGNRVSSTLTLNPYRVRFLKYKDFSFIDPNYSDNSYSEDLENFETDKQGKGTIQFDLSKFEQATFRLRLKSEAFEKEGGRSVVSETSTIVSPNDFLIGLKANGDTNFMKKGTKRRVEFICVSPELKKIQCQDLKIKKTSYDYVAVLQQQSNGTYRYETVKKEKTLSNKPFTVNAKSSFLNLDTDKGGDYKLQILNKDDKLLAAISYTVAGERNLARNLDKLAELKIKIPERDFKAGEKISMEIKAPYKGHGLITIEREKVFASKWFTAGKETTIQTITIPKDLEGGAYINVSYLRDQRSDKIQMSPYSFGVVPFSLNAEKRKTKIDFKVADVSKPGEKLTVKFKANKKTKIILYGVNEGILQLAKYQVPNPLKHFFKKKRLEVDTFQLLDLLLPEYSIVKRNFAEGGGYGSGVSSNLNPFARKVKDPVAFWSGVIDVKKGWNSFEYEIPPYFNGSMRIMAVSVSEDSIGRQFQNAYIRGDIIIAPNVPTFAAPNDTFIVTSTFTNNMDDSGKDAPINISLEVSDNLEVVGEKTKILKIDPLADKNTSFTIKAKGKLGNADVKFIAAHQGKSAKYNSTMSIRPISAYNTSSWMSMIKGTGKTQINLTRDTYAEFAKKELTISNLPFGLTTGLFSYLAKYPYGCSEQITSKAFPYLIMASRPDSKVKRSKITQFLNQTFNTLLSRQGSEGNIGLYSSNGHYRDYISPYVFHLLVEAKYEGFKVPKQLYENLLQYIKHMAANSKHFYERSYAIYLATRAGIVTTQYIVSWETELSKANLNESYQTDVSTAYVAASYALLKNKARALELIEPIKLSQKSQHYYRYYSSMQREGAILYLISKHFKEKAMELKIEKITDLFDRIKNGRYNSLSSNYLLMGLNAYSNSVSPFDPKDVKLTLTSKNSKGEFVSTPVNLTGMKSFKDYPLTLATAGINIDHVNSKKNLFISVTQAGFDKGIIKDAIASNVMISKLVTDLKGNAIDQVSLGDEAIVELRIKSTDGNRYGDVAVVDLLPAGFDLVVDTNNRISGGLNIAVDGTNLNTDFIDAREERVILYSNISSSEQIFKYKIKAVNRGDFKVPGTQAEALYHSEVKFIGLSKTVSVK